MPTIDRVDARYILLLNAQAATFSKLAQVTTSDGARGVYLASMLTWQGDLERAVFAAMQRAGIQPVIGSCAGCYAAGRIDGYQQGLAAAERQATA